MKKSKRNAIFMMVWSVIAIVHTIIFVFLLPDAPYCGLGMSESDPRFRCAFLNWNLYLAACGFLYLGQIGGRAVEADELRAKGE